MLEKVKKRKTLIISFISFIIPAIIFIAIVIFVLNQVAQVGCNQRLTKMNNYTELVNTTPKNATVFFGDSITELCPLNDIYASYVKDTGIPVINRGISAETTAQMLERFEDNVINIHPQNLVMLMGINDLSQKIELEDIINNIEQMINMIKTKQPNINIIIQAVYPINISNQDSFYNKRQLKNRDNQAIKELNRLIKELANDKEITFLDVNDYLIDSNGELKKEFSEDGLHPNTKGYLAIKDKIIEELKK